MPETMTLIAFYRSLEPGQYYIVDHDADGPFVFPIDDGLAAVDIQYGLIRRVQL